MDGHFSSSERMSFNNMSQFPTSDPVVWNFDEGWCVLFVLKIIYHIAYYEEPLCINICCKLTSSVLQIYIQYNVYCSEFIDM